MITFLWKLHGQFVHDPTDGVQEVCGIITKLCLHETGNSAHPWLGLACKLVRIGVLFHCYYRGPTRSWLHVRGAVNCLTCYAGKPGNTNPVPYIMPFGLWKTIPPGPPVQWRKKKKLKGKIAVHTCAMSQSHRGVGPISRSLYQFRNTTNFIKLSKKVKLQDTPLITVLNVFEIT